jgi:hypothetical protein
MPTVAERIAMTPGDCEAREGAEEEGTSAIQHKREPPKIIIEAQISKGGAERPAHRRRIDRGGTGHIDLREKQRNGGRRDGARHYRSYKKTHGIHSLQGLGHRFRLQRKSARETAAARFFHITNR